MSYADRITSAPDHLEGEPIIRHLHLPVSLLLDLMQAGMADEDLLGMYPDLEPDDLAAVREWADQGGSDPAPA